MDDAEVNPGGGSGGGSGDRNLSGGASFQIDANELELLAMPQALPADPTSPLPCQITIVAASSEEPLPGNGQVRVRGAQGVRITTGPDVVVPTASALTNGVEIIVADEPPQTVTLQCGPVPGVSPTIQMTPKGITIDVGPGQLTLKSLAQITLSVAGGLSTITLGPQGIVIKGLLVQIN
jgi:hypothetical protein